MIVSTPNLGSLAIENENNPAIIKYMYLIQKR